MFLSFDKRGRRSWLGDSIMSISPFWIAATWVCASGMAIHSTRSTLTTLPPARPEAGSARGLYLGFLTNTVFSPGFHSLALKMNGPDPITSSTLIWVLGSVSAVFLGIMKGTFDEGLPSDCSTRPYGSFIFILKVLPSTTSKPATVASSFWAIESLAAQRLIEAMQSSDVTGVPLLHCRPSRSVKVQVKLSADTSYLSTIWGFTSNFSSMANSVSQTM